MKQIRKKAGELLISWTSNEKNWDTIGKIAGYVRRATFFGCSMKMFTIMMLLRHKQVPLPHIEIFFDLAKSLIWSYPMWSMVIDGVETRSRKTRATFPTYGIRGNEVWIISEIDVSKHARLFLKIRSFLASLFVAGAVCLVHLNTITVSDLLMILAINIVEIVARIVRHLAYGKCFSLREESLNENHQEKLFERIDDIIKLEREKLQGLDNRPYLVQESETKIAIVSARDLIRKFKNPDLEEYFEVEIEKLLIKIANADKEKPTVTRSDIGYVWYSFGCIGFFLSFFLLIALCLSSLFIAACIGFIDNPYAIYFGMTSYIVLHEVFLLSLHSKNGGDLYDTVLYCRMFVTFGDNKCNASLNGLKKNIIVVFSCSIVGFIFYHFSLLSISELTIFLSVFSTYLSLYIFFCICFSRFVNKVVESENIDLVPETEMKVEEGDLGKWIQLP